MRKGELIISKDTKTLEKKPYQLYNLPWYYFGIFAAVVLAMVACGLLGTLGTWQRVTKKKRMYAAFSPEEALAQAAWDVFLDKAPKKYDINDITYIPIQEETLSRKNGDLMILYDLLPEIAVQAYNRIHALEEPAKESPCR